MSSKATILLIGGAFQTTDFYQPLKSALESLDHPVVIPTLPTCSDIDRVELGKTKVKDDVRVVQAELESLVNQSKRVVVLVYSYGGQVGSSLNVQDWTVSARQEKGLEGGLEYLLWYASAAFPENVSFRQARGGVIPDFDECMPDGTYNFLIAGDTFLDELSPADQEKWSAKVIPQTQDVFDYSISDAAWKYVPSITLVTENDKAIPAEYQHMTAQMIGSKRVVRLSGMGHGAHLAHTKDLAQAIGHALQDVKAS